MFPALFGMFFAMSSDKYYCLLSSEKNVTYIFLSIRQGLMIRNRPISAQNMECAQAGSTSGHITPPSQNNTYRCCQPPPVLSTAYQSPWLVFLAGAQISDFGRSKRQPFFLELSINLFLGIKSGNFRTFFLE